MKGIIMIPSSFSADRDVETGFHKISEVFSGLSDSPALAKLFKSREEVSSFLEGVTLRVARSEGYMYVDPWDGSIVVSWRYLVDGEERDLYLDIVHELIHVNQWHKGMDLYDRHYTYTERPTEAEAYAIVVDEAKRIGMSREEILEYLRVPWISEKELQRLAKKMGIQ
jgi:hypothetical protein